MKSPERMPQLDGLRAIAVSLVVVHHWTRFGPTLDLGNVGVQLFFVLSGYLITGILLDARAGRDLDRTELRSILASFWQSRAARIWPVCFLTLFAVLAVGDRMERRADMAWHFLFASNILFALRGEYASGLAHFWTLAVEQQFYLLWPFAILLLPRRWLEPAAIAAIVIAPITRAALYGAGFTDFTQYNLLPFANMDSLGLGSAVAVWSRLPPVEATRRLRLLSRLAVIALVCLIANGVFGPLPANAAQTMYGVLFAWLIASAANRMPGVLGRVLESRLLVALGIVSYGVYVYHVFVPGVLGAILRRIGLEQVASSGPAFFALSALVTVAAAALSWLLLERPINRARRQWQKRRIPGLDSREAETVSIPR